MFYLAGVQSLVMKVPPTSAAAASVAANPGHPHLGLWLASGSTGPMIIVIRPSWFSDGSSYYAYIPGEVAAIVIALGRECLCCACGGAVFRWDTHYVSAPSFCSQRASWTAWWPSPSAAGAHHG